MFAAIGGDDSFRLIPYLMEDGEFVSAVKKFPKVFSGFSDTTVIHLMLYTLGLATYYGLACLTDMGELDKDMLPYTKAAFDHYMGKEFETIESSPYWYEERKDFGSSQYGVPRVRHKEGYGHRFIIEKDGKFTGELLGGCLETLYDMCVGERHPEEQKIIQQHGIFPAAREWEGKVLFLETSESKSAPKKLEHMLTILEKNGVFKNLQGVILGKPQDEVYFFEYEEIYTRTFCGYKYPVVYNVNFGHALPRTVLPYGRKLSIDCQRKELRFV
nr:LD-carboxypeptidase [Treponema phagedenis]